MLTKTDVENLLNFFSENYIICKYDNGYSKFTELLLKKDVYVDEEIKNNEHFKIY